MKVSALFSVIRPYVVKVERVVKREYINLVSFLKSHYTWLSFFIMVILGSMWICFLSWFSRYRFYDWWRWRDRAVRLIIVYSLTLFVARILIFYM